MAPAATPAAPPPARLRPRPVARARSRSLRLRGAGVTRLLACRARRLRGVQPVRFLLRARRTYRRQEAPPADQDHAVRRAQTRRRTPPGEQGVVTALGRRSKRDILGKRLLESARPPPAAVAKSSNRSAPPSALRAAVPATPRARARRAGRAAPGVGCGLLLRRGGGRRGRAGRTGAAAAATAAPTPPPAPGRVRGGCLGALVRSAGRSRRDGDRRLRGRATVGDAREDAAQRLHDRRAVAAAPRASGGTSWWWGALAGCGARPCDWVIHYMIAGESPPARRR